jgi:hypothetical protein
MGTVILCLLLADFLTGLGHWIEDTYGVPTWPLIGAEVIEPNIMHHQHPTWIATMSTVLSRNYQTMIPAALISAAALLYFGLLSWPLVLVAFATALGNETHTWAHRSPDENGRLIRAMQNSGLVLMPLFHARHHRPPYDRYYCTLFNVTNEFCEMLRIWRFLESVLRITVGIEVKRMTAERRGY